MNEQTPYTNNNEVYTETVHTQPQQVVYAQPLTPPENKLWQIFAKLSFIFGFVGFGCAFVPGLNNFTVYLSIAGIVFGILGKKDPDMYAKAKTGFVWSIIGTVVGIIFMGVYAALLGI